LDGLLYGTYLGGDGLDVAQALKLDGAGGLWLAGYTLSRDFPVTPNAYRTFNAGVSDVFLTRLDLSRLRSREAISYSTYLGGVDTDVLYGLALAPGGRIALAGYTYSADFPRVGSSASAPMLADAFVALLDPAIPGPGALAYSAVIGGIYIDTATGVAVDASGRILVSGYTNSPDLPVTDGSKKPSPPGATQSFVVQVAP
ncbi:MAG: SBBP repeat-containing protein, partial [Acidobacteria bacterium]|nr:SBBP repeat-containing protein [Acidobacteriota bacterium]